MSVTALNPSLFLMIPKARRGFSRGLAHANPGELEYQPRRGFHALRRGFIPRRPSRRLNPLVNKKIVGWVEGRVKYDWRNDYPRPQPIISPPAPTPNVPGVNARTRRDAG